MQSHVVAVFTLPQMNQKSIFESLMMLVSLWYLQSQDSRSPATQLLRQRNHPSLAGRTAPRPPPTHSPTQKQSDVGVPISGNDPTNTNPTFQASCEESRIN